MDWLIVEDSLEDRTGHWFEYLAAFQAELPRLGDRVTWLVSKNAGPDVLRQFDAKPVLPASIFRKLSDGAPAWRRYARIPLHAWKTFLALRRYLASEKFSGCIFVPTVTLHHLLGWYALSKLVLTRHDATVLLFFPGLPIRGREEAAAMESSPTARLMRLLLRALVREIDAGKVILGVETEAMRHAAERVFGVPFKYFPHPVKPLAGQPATNAATPGAPGIMFGSYGPGRYEKGSDILVSAIEQYLRRYPESRARFVFQWLDDFPLPNGRGATVPPALKNHPRVKIINRLFVEGEYARWLASTDALVLPYRQSSYGLRVSRVIIEALVNGLPIVVTRKTTLAEQALGFGAPVICADGDVESLVQALQEIEQNFAALKTQAKSRVPLARDHFSVAEFRKFLFDYVRG